MRLYVRYHNGEQEEYRDVRYASAYPNPDRLHNAPILRVEFNYAAKESLTIELREVLNFWLVVDKD